MRTCVVDIFTRLVVNVIERGLPQTSPNVKEADGPLPGFKWVDSDVAGIGWSMDDAGVLHAPPMPQPTVEEMQKSIESRLQAELDKAALAHGYDDLRSAISYRGSSNPTWAHEGDSFFAWRDAVWSKAIATMAQVAAGKAAMPTPDEAVAMMPALVI